MSTKDLGGKYVSEQELNAKAVAPRVTLEAIEAEIVGENYFTAHQGARASILDDANNMTKMTMGDLAASIPDALRLTTYCVLTMRNGFTITGQSACASPENYDEDIGRRVARGDAIRQIWPLMGYELRSRLAAQKEAAVGDTLGEALTRMTAYRLGNPKSFRPSDAEVILKHFEDTDTQEEGGETYAVLPPSVEAIAEMCHEANRAYCQMQGDMSQPKWADAPDWQKASAIDGVEFALANPLITPADSHANWLKDKENAGWKYGEIKDPEKKEHPCFVPYDQLPQSQQIKDYIFLTVVRAASNLA
jgi:hypothetical protein